MFLYVYPINSNLVEATALGDFLCRIPEKPTDTPHLIVGAGLAGCLLAWELQKRDAPFIILGSETLPAAFKVAAGVINPVTGRWMTKSWNFDQLGPKAEQTYQAIEEELGLSIYHPIPELRFCQNSDDIKRIGRRQRNPRYADVLGDYHEPGKMESPFNDDCGSFEIQRAAYVDLPAFVNALRRSFRQSVTYRSVDFDHSELKTESGVWSYRDIQAERVIFCEGAAVSRNPWFKEIPLQAVKGETLRCKSSTLQLPKKLFHHKKWLLPYPDGTFRIGASYDESDSSPTPTERQKQALLDAAQDALQEKHHFEVTEHLAGIRPSTVDTRPILGSHKTAAGLYVFNGLGSKGASVGPLMAEQLAEHLLDGGSLDPEVDIARFH